MVPTNGRVNSVDVRVATCFGSGREEAVLVGLRAERAKVRTVSTVRIDAAAAE